MLRPYPHRSMRVRQWWARQGVLARVVAALLVGLVVGILLGYLQRWREELAAVRRVRRLSIMKRAGEHLLVDAGDFQALLAPVPPTGGADHPPPRLVVLSTFYRAGYSADREYELRRVVERNVGNPLIDEVHLLVEDGVDHGFVPGSKVVTQRFDGQPTYGNLFTYANSHLLGQVVLLSNADIYFDPTVACARVLLSPPARRTVFALSRHPAPECPAASGHGAYGDEPVDLCQGYDPVDAASHDVFAFVPPVPEGLVAVLRDVPQNLMGAENVVIRALLDHGFQVLNPCLNIHAFHLHCNDRQRGKSKHFIEKRISKLKHMFAGTTRHGFLSLPGASGLERTDCLLAGLRAFSPSKPFGFT